MLQENKVIIMVKNKLTRKSLKILKRFSEKSSKAENEEDDEIKEVGLDDEEKIIEQEPEEKEDAYLYFHKYFGPEI